MSDLPLIPNPNPVTIPAVEAVAYSESYIVKFVMGTTDTGGNVQPIKVSFRPYNYASKLLYPDDSLDICETFPNAWELAQSHPLAAQVIGGLVQVFSLELQLRQQDKAISVIQGQLDGANARLADIATQLTTETDADVVAALTAEQTALTATVADLTTQLVGPTAARAAILTTLGVV